MRALLLVALVACTDHTTLRFSDLDDKTIDRLIGASSGGDALWAVQDIVRFHDSSDDDPACPTVTESDGGRLVTIVGGCTTRDGVTIEGVARAHEHSGWGGDGTNASYEFDDYRVAGKTYDGTLHLSESSAPKFELSADLTFDGSLHSSMLIDCDEADCKLAGGIELIGHGSVTVSGTTPFGVQVPRASWKLRGEETVEVWTGDNLRACVQWRIVETGRTPALVICPR
jgi:hypothetical protein